MRTIRYQGAEQEVRVWSIFSFISLVMWVKIVFSLTMWVKILFSGYVGQVFLSVGLIAGKSDFDQLATLAASSSKPPYSFNAIATDQRCKVAIGHYFSCYKHFPIVFILKFNMLNIMPKFNDAVNLFQKVFLYFPKYMPLEN